MPRQDLEDLREEIVSLGYLTVEEQYALQYYGEERLRETLEALQVIADEEKFEEEYESLEFDQWDEFADYEDYWEVEATGEYPND